MISHNELINKRRLLKHLIMLTADLDISKPVLLLDADRTLCREDTGKIVFDRLDLQWHEVKEGFKKNAYTFKGFKIMSDILSSANKNSYMECCFQVASELDLYPGVIEFLLSAKRFLNVIVVTAGCGPIWNMIVSENNINSVYVIAGGHSKCDDFLIGRNEKGYIVDYFQCITDNPVISIGDSDVDTLMLNGSDKKGVVVNHRRNQDLFNNFDKSNIDFQITFEDYYHDGIRVTSFFELNKIIKGEMV